MEFRGETKLGIMKREIKFRGKRIDNEGYVYGSLVNTNQGECYIMREPYFIPTKTTPSEWFIKVDPKTVGQFTGLKDKNGDEIYDGDILHCNDGFIGKTREILWNENNHCWAYKILDGVESAAGKNLLNEIRNIGYKRVNDILLLGNIHE